MHEIFVAEFLAQSKPVWVFTSNLGVKQINKNIYVLGLIFVILLAKILLSI
jgi:hypothetical protein